MGKLTYTKSKEDSNRENYDLLNDPTLLYIKHKDSFKFNVGDILILEEKLGGTGWRPVYTSSISKAPTKYMYVFENNLGIGYVKQLKSDGSGLGDGLKCITEFNGEYQRFSLDPDYADHILLAEPGEEFDYARTHQAKLLFRKKAIAKNKKLLKNLSTPELCIEYVHSLKVGDLVHIGHDWDSACGEPHVVDKVTVEKKHEINRYSAHAWMNTREWHLIDEVVSVRFKSTKDAWRSITINVFDVESVKILTSRPFPLKDENCV